MIEGDVEFQGDIRVVVSTPGKPPEVKMIPAGWRTFGGLVGGTLQMVPIDIRRGLHLYCNENGKALKLAPNFRVTEDDVLLGPAIGFKMGDDGREVSLTDEEAEDVRRVFFEAARAWAFEEMSRKSPAMALGLSMFGGLGQAPKNPFLRSNIIPPDNGRGRT